MWSLLLFGAGCFIVGFLAAFFTIAVCLSAGMSRPSESPYAPCDGEPPYIPTNYEIHLPYERHCQTDF